MCPKSLRAPITHTYALISNFISSSVGATTVIADRQRLSSGGVLSPLLWSILIDDLHAKLSAESYDCLGYADVLAIVIREKYAETIMDHSQSTLNLVNDWYSRHGLTINPIKTTAAVFTRKLILDRLRLPSLDGVEIPWQMRPSIWV